MRAVAVLAVIGAHASVAGFGGGFVGVDVFFVISGFLITRLILTSIVADGTFRIGAFYARRARRIVPAASVVLAITILASVVYLNFLDAIDATRDAIWAALFGANIRFATQGVDYFALEESPSPMQHYWSLAVEEQFYLVWPLLVLIAVGITRVRLRRRRRNDDGRSRVKRTAPVKTMAFFALLVGGASLAWSVHRTEVEPTSAYFSTLTRAWELAAGVLVALVLHRRAGIRHRWITEPLAFAGVGGIVFAVTAYDTTMAFPGWQALLPVLATSALILAGSHETDKPVLSRLLGIPPLTTIGDWSYSLYLWHWPIIVIPQVNMGRGLGVTETLIAVALVFQFGYLTHRFVEEPFRRGEFWRSRQWRGLILYPASLVLVLPATFGAYQYAVYLGGERGNAPAITADDVVGDDDVINLVEASVLAGRAGQSIPSDLTPDLIDLDESIADVGECNYQLKERPLCRRGAPDGDKVMVVTGDSHARAWIPAFEKIANEAGYAAYYLVKQQCTASFVDPARLGIGTPWPECAQFHDWVVDQVTDLKPDLLIVATSPPPTGVYNDAGEHITSRDGVHTELATGFDDMFARYQPLADEVLLLEDVPRLPEEPAACLAVRDHDLGDCMFPPTEYNEEMRQVSVDAAVRAGVAHVDPTDWLCWDGDCPLVIGSTIAYRDRSHITSTRAEELWQPLGAALGLLDDRRSGRASHSVIR